MYISDKATIIGDRFTEKIKLMSNNRAFRYVLVDIDSAEFSELKITRKQLLVLSAIYYGCYCYFEVRKDSSTSTNHMFRASEIVELSQGYPPPSMRRVLGMPEKVSIDMDAPINKPRQIKGLAIQLMLKGLIVPEKISVTKNQIDHKKMNILRGQLKQGEYQRYMISEKGLKYMSWYLMMGNNAP